MDFHRVVLQVTWVGVLFSRMAAGAVAAQLARPNCTDRCGDVEIPFPFGITKDCYLNEDFQLYCNPSSGQLLTGKVTVTNISLLQGQLDILMYIAHKCYKESGSLGYHNSAFLTGPSFTISNTENTFMAVGCDTYAYFNGFQGSDPFSMGCMSLCRNISSVLDGSCSGIGCCQMGIPPGLKNFTLYARSFYNHTETWTFNPCSFAFVVEKDRFNFAAHYLWSLQDNETLPMVLDWAIGKEGCDKSNPICGPNSTCYDPKNRHGYRCRCLDGFEGNPYLTAGCQDINECDDNSNHCNGYSTCSNTIGNFACPCKDGYEGDGRRGGPGCTLKQSNSVTRVTLGFSICSIVVFVCSLWLYLVVKQRKLIKLRERYFRENGGLTLNQKLSQQENSTEATKIFSTEELKKATNNYDDNLIIGQGGFGIVYKGFLSNNRVVAIKKSKVVDQNQIDQFINEVVILSQINHRNVVKLLGCCLETETPLLVYEFVPNGTLFQHIHQESDGYILSWETRLRIATETAEALSYLHSAASPPIIHRDVKSSNILLDGCYTTKVSDFGASRLVPLDQTQVATMVQGTFGYLDPEYLHTSQLTEKSDVYSFGVVLIELLTGEKALSFERPEKGRSLAMYFLSSIEEDRLFGIFEKQIVNEGNVEQMKEVANLAKRCLKVKGEDRPTMKEVAIGLEGLRSTEKHLWVNSNFEETEYLLGENSASHNNDTANNGSTGYDSVRDQMLFAYDDGR